MRYTVLRRNNDFTRLYSRGKSYVSSGLVTYVFKNRSKHTRVGITTSKKVGNAVKRNRARRVIRASMYNVLPKEVGSVDIVFVARAATAKMKSTQVQKLMKKHLISAGLIEND